MASFAEELLTTNSGNIETRMYPAQLEAFWQHAQHSGEVALAAVEQQSQASTAA